MIIGHFRTTYQHMGHLSVNTKSILYLLSVQLFCFFLPIGILFSGFCFFIAPVFEAGNSCQTRFMLCVTRAYWAMQPPLYIYVITQSGFITAQDNIEIIYISKEKKAFEGHSKRERLVVSAS